MDTLTMMPRYEAYKDSGVEWLGEVPTHWELKKIKYIFDFTERGSAPTYVDKGVMVINQACLSTYTLNTRKAKYHSTNVNISDFRGKLKANDLLLASTGHGILGKCAINNINTESFVDSHVTIIRDSKNKFNTKFLFYIFLVLYDFINSNMAEGSTNQTELQRDDLRLFLMPVPPNAELTGILTYLDQKTAQIDEAVAIKEKHIDLLKEYKQGIIQHAVTRGLNPDVSMRDSGIEWIGDIPEHWEVKKAKYLFKEINERSATGEEELLSVSHFTGVTPRSEKNVNMFMAEDYSGSKVCRKNDLVFNIMWAWMGALGVSNQIGIVSSSYGVFRQIKQGIFNSCFLEYLLRSNRYVEYYNKISTGLHSSRLRFYGHMFLATKIGFPPIAEQNEIINYLAKKTSQIDEAIAIQQEQISKLKEYKSTLINSAVTGKIKVV